MPLGACLVDRGAGQATVLPVGAAREVILQGDLGKELHRLVRLGMLVEERPDGDRRVWYTRTDSKLWKIIEAAAEALGPG